MAWLAKTFTALDSAPLWSDLNHLHDDTATWGGNVDAGSHALSNLSLLNGLLPISITASSAFPAAIKFVGGGDNVGRGRSLVWSLTGGPDYIRIHDVTVGAGLVDLAFDTNPVGAGAIERMRLTNDGKLGIGVTAPKSALAVAGLPSYASNAAAISGGLAAGDCYLISASNPRQMAVVF